MTTLLAVAALGAAAVPVATAATKHKHKVVTKKVAVKDDVYGTDKLTVHVGDTVKWVWDPTNYNSHDVKLLKGPSGVKKFHSPSGTIGIAYKQVFKKAGKYQIYCTIHPATMAMTITVKKAAK